MSAIPQIKNRPPLKCRSLACIIGLIEQTPTHNDRCRVCGGPCEKVEDKHD